MRRRGLAGMAVLGLVIAAAVVGGASGPPASSGAARPEHPRLYLAGIGEMWVVDVDAETARDLRMPHLGAGDPPHFIAPVGDRIALWSYDVWSVPLRHPGGPATLLVKDGWIFIPSADPNAIWVGFLGPSPNRGRTLDELREIDSDGNVIARTGRPPHGAWPYADADAGLVFQLPGRTVLWDPETERTIRKFPYRRTGDLGPISDNTVASCLRGCRTLALTDLSTGSQRRIAAPDGSRLVAYESTFSSDGTKLAIPLLRGTNGWRDYSERGRRLAIVDLETGRTDVVRGSKVPEGYVFTGWSSDDRTVFITGGVNKRSIVAFRPGERRAHELDVDVGGFYDMIAR